MGLPHKPPISFAFIDECDQRDPFGRYTGPIEEGMVFAWEPYLPHARETVVVTKLAQGHVFSNNIDRPAEKICINDEDRFREAVYPTMFNKMKVS